MSSTSTLSKATNKGKVLDRKENTILRSSIKSVLMHRRSMSDAHKKVAIRAEMATKKQARKMESLEGSTKAVVAVAMLSQKMAQVAQRMAKQADHRAGKAGHDARSARNMATTKVEKLKQQICELKKEVAHLRKRLNIRKRPASASYTVTVHKKPAAGTADGDESSSEVLGSCHDSSSESGSD